MIEASETLMELSAGQYQLDRDNRNDLIVIDHQDAGASRPVHTLSDGETFQASLALAWLCHARSSAFPPGWGT